MALTPTDAKHLAQILAGTTGRNYGHTFEKTLSEIINEFDLKIDLMTDFPEGNLVVGNPAKTLINYIVKSKKLKKVEAVKAWWLGGLATSGLGDEVLDDKGVAVRKSKSDILVEIKHESGIYKTGVSVKTCNKTSPTNDQIYFTTASAFCSLLRVNGVDVSKEAEIALKMFCGDAGYRPLDNEINKERKSDPNRWFYEELPEKEKEELLKIFSDNQSEITRILLQKAYSNDPFPPQFLLHQTKSFNDYNDCEIAIFEMEKLIEFSKKYQGFWLKSYLIRKGTYRGDVNAHFAPRFGFIQFQRGGQKQHPTQLQFNLEAGYFYKLPIEAAVLPEAQS